MALEYVYKHQPPGRERTTGRYVHLGEPYQVGHHLTSRNMASYILGWTCTALSVSRVYWYGRNAQSF